MTRARRLRVSLKQTAVGTLQGETGGRQLFLFDDDYIERDRRPTLSMSFTVPHDDEATRAKLGVTYASRVRAPVYFSNLLPEGAMRELVAQRLGVAIDDELAMLSVLGGDLPGAVITEEIDSYPVSRTKRHEDAAPEQRTGFSLAGVQLKFSMLARGSRLTIPKSDAVGDYIVKPPSTAHADLPSNEYAMMRFAASAGVDTPAVRLVATDQLEGIDLPRQNERLAYAIERFDRSVTGRIHAEDFAQVLELRPHQKYRHTNYDTMARIIVGAFPNGMQQLEEMVRRLVVNILVGNADAHIKNWSVIYRDDRTPALAPAYDIVCTLQYASSSDAALNMGREMSFYAIDEEVWRRFARRVGVSETFVTTVVIDTVGRAHDAWPALWRDLTLSAALRTTLREHWQKLPSLYAMEDLVSRSA